MTTPIELVINAASGFGVVKKSGTGYVCNCPAHDDKNPSLSITETGGKVLIYCHAGCDPAAITAAWGLEMSDLFPTDEKPEPPRVVATYGYTDKFGKLIYTVKRFMPKSFRPYLPGAAYPGLDGVEQTLFRLPQIIAAANAHETIYVVEGERDVMTVETAGFTATTNPLGSKNWRAEYGEYFVGAKLVRVIADNDDAGRAWAVDVADSLKQNGVDFETLVCDGPSGWDVTDHFAAGKTLDNLTPLEDSTVPVEESENPFMRALIDWSTFFNSERVEHDWFCEPILARARGHALYAEAKGGKSFFVLPMACHVATGAAWLAMPEQSPRHVLIVDYEQSDADVWERMQQFGFDDDSDLSYLHYCLLPASEGLDTKRGGIELIEMVMDIGAELVIVDTVSRAVEGEENSADTLRNYYKFTGKGLKAHGVTVQRLDHAGKDKARGVRGTSAKADDVDVVAYVKRLGTESIEIVTTHSRMGWMPNSTKINVREDERGIIRHTLATSGSEGGYAAGAADDGRILMLLGVDKSTTIRAARNILAESDVTMSGLRLSDAMRYIKTIGAK